MCCASRIMLCRAVPCCASPRFFALQLAQKYQLIYVVTLPYDAQGRM
jgi:hypothetical protein